MFGTRGQNNLLNDPKITVTTPPAPAETVVNRSNFHSEPENVTVNSIFETAINTDVIADAAGTTTEAEKKPKTRTRKTKTDTDTTGTAN